MFSLLCEGHQLPCCHESLDPYRELFPLKSPHFLVNLFQVLLLGQAAHMALCVMLFFQLPQNWMLPQDGSIGFFTTILLVVPAVYFLAVYTMCTIERCTLLFSLGSLAKHKLILKALAPPSTDSH